MAGRNAWVLAGLAALALLVGLGWLGAATRMDMRAASQKAIRVAELRGTIAYLDEWLTMSALMASSSGASRWAERYDEAAPKLDAAIAEASDLATPEIRTALAATTIEAHRDLVAMERRALSLARNHDLSGAQALLESAEFSYLKDVYASGIEVFGQQLTTLADARADALSSRAWMEAAGLCLSGILLVGTAFSIRGHTRLRHALAQTAAVAGTDALTELPNRRQFYRELETALASTDGTDRSCALLLIDLDGFKAANDTHGHLCGDQLLRLVAARLRAVLRDGDLIARLGGDEFALVTPFETADPRQPSNKPAAEAHHQDPERTVRFA